MRFGFDLGTKESSHAEDDRALDGVGRLLITEDRVLSFAVADLTNHILLFVIDSHATLHQHESGLARS